jgi:hypothetical protein
MVIFFDAAPATVAELPAKAKTDAAKVEATAAPWMSRMEREFILVSPFVHHARPSRTISDNVVITLPMDRISVKHHRKNFFAHTLKLRLSRKNEEGSRTAN